MRSTLGTAADDGAHFAERAIAGPFRSRYGPDCLLSASGWNGSVGLSARATCGSPSPTDLPSDGCPKMREPHDS